MSLMTRISQSLPGYWEALKSFLNPSRGEPEEESCDEPPSKRRRGEEDCELLGVSKPEVINVAKQRVHRLRGEDQADDFLLCLKERPYNFPNKLKRKSHLEFHSSSPPPQFVTPRCSASERFGKQNEIVISDDCDGENKVKKKSPLKEDMAVLHDMKDIAGATNAENAENTAPRNDGTTWLDAKSTCKVFGRRDIKADKENDVKVLKVVAPSFLEKQSSIAPVFAPSSKMYNPVLKQPMQAEMSGGGGALKRPSATDSLSSLCSSQSSLMMRKLPLLEQSIRLEEKEKYSELLQSYTNLAVSKLPTMLDVRDRQPRLPPMSFVSRVRRKYPSTVECIDLTSQPESRDEEQARAGSDKEAATESPSSELRKKLERCHVYDISWVEEMSKMYNRKERETRKRILEEQVKAALCTKKSDQMLNEILEERVRLHLRLSAVAVEEGPVPIAEDEIPLPELTPAMESRISYAFGSGPGGEVLAQAFSLNITRRDIHTLVGTNWLNDEIINFYMNLLIERGKLDNYPSVYCFNTFFYPKLASQGHAALKRWTRKIDVFRNELLIVPVHLDVHWCLACVHLKERRIQYFDSMGGSNNTCLQNLMRYLQDESWDKKKVKFDTSGWRLENMKDNPQQMNGSDCGMFSCMYAEYLCRKAKINFAQSDMPYFRRKMAYEILSVKLLL